MPLARILSALFGLLLAATVTAFADLEDYTWSLSGTLSQGETANEVFIAVENETAFEAATIEVHYDTTVLELQAPLADNVQLVNRASDLTLLPTKLDSWDYVRMTVFSTVQTPPIPDVEAGSGGSVKLREWKPKPLPRSGLLSNLKKILLPPRSSWSPAPPNRLLLWRTTTGRCLEAWI